MAVIYRYVDLQDEIIKYVGIVWSGNRTLKQRVEEHLKNDDWVQNRAWRIEYLRKNVNSRTDAEYLEAHYVSKFDTGKYYNKTKTDWGESELIDDNQDEWAVYSVDETPVSKWNVKTTISKIQCGNRFLEWGNNFKYSYVYRVSFDNMFIDISMMGLVPIEKDSAVSIDIGLIILNELHKLYKNPSIFPDIKDENLPISYRISELDGETVESVKIGTTTVAVQKKDDGAYEITSMLDSSLAFNNTSPYLDISQYGKDRSNLLKDLEKASKHMESPIYIPDEQFMDPIFNSNTCYADVCKRIGDHVLTGISQGEFLTEPYLVSQYNYLRKDGKYADLPAAEPVFPKEELN